MIPATYDLALYRGDTGRWQFKLWQDAAKTQPVDLTGVVVLVQIRDKASGGSFMQWVDTGVVPPNIINMTLTPEQSRNLPNKGVWDMELDYPSGDVVTVLKGAVAVTNDVTIQDAP